MEIDERNSPRTSKRKAESESFLPSKKFKSLAKNYKAVSIIPKNGQLRNAVVPKQTFVRKSIAKHFIPNYFSRDEKIVPYETTKKYPRVLKKFHNFGSYVCSGTMKNGHEKINAIINDNGMQLLLSAESWKPSAYAFTVEKEGELYGAIVFGIVPELRKVVIEGLDVAESKRQTGIGSSLVQLAIFVGSLYGYSVVELYPTLHAASMYQAHGFWFFAREAAEYHVEYNQQVYKLISQPNSYLAEVRIDEIEMNFFNLRRVAHMRLDTAIASHLITLNAHVARYRANSVPRFSDVLRHNIAKFEQRRHKLKQLLNEDYICTNIVNDILESLTSSISQLNSVDGKSSGLAISFVDGELS